MILYNPIICAADTTGIASAKKIATSLTGSIGAIKLGLEFFTANGAAGVAKVSQAGLPIFLDLKFHDIPNTVAGAIRALSDMNIFMLTVHTGGGADMMRAAVKAARSLPCKPLVVGVTVLTGLDDEDLDSVGVKYTVKNQVKKLANLAQECGLDGVVCSPHEAKSLREQCGKKFKLVTPGIRPAGSRKGDQKRIKTPQEALRDGADYLVIGRPITEAENPALAAKEIAESLYNS